MIYFLKEFRQYLLGKKFCLRTDHSALQWLRRTPEPIGQQARWLETIEEFDFEIVHRAGTKHGNADAMSRGPMGAGPEDEDIVEESAAWICPVAEARPVAAAPVEDVGQDLGWSKESLRKEQLDDRKIGPVLAWKESGRQPTELEAAALSEETKTVLSQWELLEVRQGVLF